MTHLHVISGVASCVLL